jgi:hypothetical protein
VDLTG